MRLLYLIALLIVLPTGSLFAQPKLVLQPFATGFSGPLWVAHAEDGRLFIVQQRGLIRIVDSTGTVLPQPFLDLRNKVSQSGSEKGLLGLAFHPNYAQNGYFYVNYTREGGGAGGTTIVSRFSMMPGNPNRADSLSEVEVINASQPYSNHNGGWIGFGPDGYLYIAMGDGGSGGDPQNYAQNRNTGLGKMLRLDIDVDSTLPYRIPIDNPFIGDFTTLDEIWALGLRNPWRCSFDKLTGDLWIADVGQNAQEEVNFQPASSTGGENYGWRCYEGNAPYNLNGCGPASAYTFPAFTYAHYGASCGGSITGGYVYRGALYRGLYGKYLAADYCKGNIYWAEQRDTGIVSGLVGLYSPFQYSSFGEDRYGELYLTMLGAGNVLRITDTSDCRPVAMVLAADTLHLCDGDSLVLEAAFHPSLQYQWMLDGAPVSGAATHRLVLSAPGNYSVLVLNPANSCTNTSESVVVIPVPVPAVTIQGLFLFYNTEDTPVTMIGVPPGGTFNGPGVVGDTFNPGLAGPGFHDIVYTLVTSEGCTVSFSMSVQVILLPGMAINDPGKLCVYPNPVNEFLMVELGTGKTDNSILEIISSTGQVLYRNPIASGTPLVVSTAGWPRGVYALRVYADGNWYVQQVVVQ